MRCRRPAAKSSSSKPPEALIRTTKPRRLPRLFLERLLHGLDRSIPELVKIVGELEKAVEGFEITKERIEISTAAGRLVFYFFAALAELERRLIGEGTMAAPFCYSNRGGGIAVTAI